MTAPVAKTKGPNLLNELSEFVTKAHRHIEIDDKSISYQKWCREAENVMRVDAAMGSIVKAKLSEAHGDVVRADYWYDNFVKLTKNHSAIAVYQLVTYSNLGYGSKGLQVFREHVDISHGNIGETIWLAIGVGAFQYMNELIKQAQRGKLELPELNMALSQEIAELMAASGTSDDTCAAVIDVAGEVLRKRRLFWLGDHAKFILDKHSNSVLMRFSVEASYKDASRMTMEAAEILIERNLDSSALMIDFVGAHA